MRQSGDSPRYSDEALANYSVESVVERDHTRERALNAMIRNAVLSIKDNSSNFVKLLVLLSLHGANINFVDKDEPIASTYLHYAVEQRALVAVLILCWSGADLHVLNGEGRTPYGLAMFNRRCQRKNRVAYCYYGKIMEILRDEEKKRSNIETDV